MSTLEGMAIVDAAACGLICWQAVAHIGRMNHRTRPVIRLSFLLLAVGAFAVAVGAMIDDVHVDIADLVAHAGIAALLIADRRRPSDCPDVDNCDWQKRHQTTGQVP